VVLAAALGVIVVLGSATRADQGFAGIAQTALTATPSADCSQCDDCAEPCTASIACSAACISGLAPSASGLALNDHRRQVTIHPGWQRSSAELRTPTPPPRLSHSV
jgi:hypothetical protein